MDISALSPSLSPLVAAALLALYGFASIIANLIKSGREDKATSTRLSEIEVRLSAFGADIEWIKETLKRMEGAK